MKVCLRVLEKNLGRQNCIISIMQNVGNKKINFFKTCTDFVKHQEENLKTNNKCNKKYLR